MVLVGCGAIPFLLLHGTWGAVLTKIYLMKALLLCILIISDLDSCKYAWFWKTVGIVMVLHSILMFGLAMINIYFPAIDRLPTVTYSMLTLVLGGETLLAMSLIEKCRPLKSGGKQSNKQ